MAKPLIREKAQSLRHNGKSIGAIAEVLKQPKSTVSYWCKNISLSDVQIQKIQSKHRAKSVATLLRFSEKQRQARFKRESEQALLGIRDVNKMSRRDLFMMGLGLYWGEGYKYENGELGFTNSNPAMMQVYIAWLEQVYGVRRKDLICRVSINKIHHDRLVAVERFWQKTLEISHEQFSTTSLIQSHSKKIYANRETHYGTLRIKVRRGKDLRARIIASLEHVAECYTE